MATQRIFGFNSCLYKQIDGVTIGSPLELTLADFFLSQLLWKKKYSDKIISVTKLYSRYIDEFCAVVADHKFCSSSLSTLDAYSIETLSFLRMLK